MRSETWEQTKDTLLDVLDVEPSKRNAFMQSLGLRPERRAEIESLIAFDTCADAILEKSALELAADFIESEPAGENINSGRVIGKYRVIRELGIGGMGVVYLAERSDGEISQRVAIKFLKREFNAAKIREMFGRERDIHARLEHPNIARVIDAGSTDDDIPFLVMEYVDGSPIDLYCRQNALGLKDRLKLFNKVCGAVAFAHRNLIIHRDLKPSNILVTADGQPKLLDFGISKLLENTPTPASVTAFIAMTPEYASPEQIRGETVTTATDIYGLGAVLFRLVTGTTPVTFDGKTNGVVVEQSGSAEIKAPSAAIANGDVISAANVRGDIDNIILKALAAEPERRYSTVEEMSADIWRHLDGQPVLARSVTFIYRAEKFVRRNKAAAAAAIVIVTSLCAGIGVSLTQANRANAQALIADNQRYEAQRASKRAEKTSKFMQSFLDYANPQWFGRGKGRLDVTVLEAIDDAANRIDVELADEPEVRADLHYTVGLVYGSQNEPNKAFQHMTKSLQLYRQIYGEQHPRVARALWYYALKIPRTDGQLPPEAEPLIRQSAEMMRETGPDDVNLPYILQSLGGWIILTEKRTKNEARLSEAESLFREARPLFVRHYGEDHIATISADSNLGHLAEFRGDLSLAETIFVENLYQHRKIGSTKDIENDFMLRLARVELSMGKQSEANELLDQVLANGRSMWDANDFRYKKLVEDVANTRATQVR